MQIPSQESNSSLVESSLNQITHLHSSAITPKIFWENYQKPGKPVVLTGLPERQPEWNLEFLIDQLGDRKFPVRFYGRERYKQDKGTWQNIGSGVESRSMRFSEYAQKLLNGEADEKDMYLGKCSLKNTPLADLPQINQVEAQIGIKNPVTDFNLWCGLGGHTTCLHCDPFDGTLIQLYGKKKVILFPPDQLYDLYPFSLINHLRYGLKLRASYSQVYPQQPDFALFPKFKETFSQRIEVVLNEGEILFIPNGWWHEVSSLGEGVVCSINRFWHITPLSRALCSWNKWRIHLASILAAPHIAKAWLAAIISQDREQKLRHLIQRL